MPIRDNEPITPIIVVALIHTLSHLALGCQRLITYPAAINPMPEAIQFAAPPATAAVEAFCRNANSKYLGKKV